ncbi:hypothetical protein SKAU_G00370350 [Synaphobranchus kaupii]|uniref:Transmembrane protein 151B n=1 Tax=Synaphobranchus kaupii TaxID=118154 RepID=A0A9Q1IFU7_SYNKA|nr:hypothetical protein SKAU_G00370350 [Synaphobranchus kaupii]
MCSSRREAALLSLPRPAAGCRREAGHMAAVPRAATRGGRLWRVPSFLADYDPGGSYHYGERARLQHDSPCSSGYVYIPLAFLAMLYVVYLVECWHCYSKTATLAQAEVGEVYERVQRLQQATPCIWWKAISYHYVRRTRQVTRYRNGDAYTTTQVYHERVNTHAAGSEFDYGRHGVQGRVQGAAGHAGAPGGPAALHQVLQLRQRPRRGRLPHPARPFLWRQRGPGRLHGGAGGDAPEERGLPRGTCWPSLTRRARPGSPAAASSGWPRPLLLSWPLRVVAEYRTAYVHYHVEKLFGDSEEGRDGNETGNESGGGVGSSYRAISRVNTVDMTELEWHIRCNQQMVPSYSEALLMDPDAGANPPPPASAGNAAALNAGYFLQNCPRCRRSSSSTSLPSRIRGSMALGGGQRADGRDGGGNEGRRGREAGAQPERLLAGAPPGLAPLLPLPLPEHGRGGCGRKSDVAQVAVLSLHNVYWSMIGPDL